MVEFHEVPPEVVEAIMRNRMESEVKSHQVKNLFTELPKDQLLALNLLLETISRVEDPGAMAAYYNGHATAIIEMKYNVCSSHGVNHAEEALEEFKKSTGDISIDKGSTPTRDDDTEEQSDFEFTQTRVNYNMELYRLKIDESTGKLVCKDCGLEYVSLEDRMVKSPDDCHGCYIKSAHG